jgi:membrane protein YdbS with pleckstrin-like domain
MANSRRFPSKIDTWLALVLVMTLILQLGVLAYVLATEVDPGTVLVAVLALGAVMLLIGLSLARTYYEVDGEELRIVSGLFRWTIPIEDIHAVEDSRSPMSSPALSLDRLRIRYGGRNRSILVSPADKRRFRQALGRAGDVGSARG